MIKPTKHDIGGRVIYAHRDAKHQPGPHGTIFSLGADPSRGVIVHYDGELIPRFTHSMDLEWEE